MSGYVEQFFPFPPPLPNFSGTWLSIEAFNFFEVLGFHQRHNIAVIHISSFISFIEIGFQK